MKVIVASENPVKINAVFDGFKRMFPDALIEIKGVKIDSDVSNQPFSDEETYKGAFLRAKKVKKLYASADFFVGIEGGIEVENGEMQSFAWIVTISNSLVGKARTTSFQIPHRVADLIYKGYELGDADDIVFGESKSKQKNGAVGLLTNDVIKRRELYSQAVILSLIPYKNKILFDVKKYK